MPKFAVYYVPPADGDLYRLGTSFLGYDVRGHKQVEIHPDLRNLPGFRKDWLSKASLYGFHLTIGDAIDFVPGSLWKIERMIGDVIACMDPGHSLTLEKPQEKFVTPWGPAVVLRYKPNDHLKVFHTLIAACVHPLGTGSGYLHRHLQNPKALKEPHEIKRTLMFYSHTVFDSYRPHFTVLHPYSGKRADKGQLKHLISRHFDRFTEIGLESICLLTQMGEGENWTVLKEFPLPHRQ